MNVTTLRSRFMLAAAFIVALVLAMSLTSYFGQRALEKSADTVARMEAGNVLLQKLLRGLNEVIVTEGSSASVKLTTTSLSEFQKLASELNTQGVAMTGVDAAWRELSTDVDKFLKLGKFGTGEDESMLAFGKLNTRAEKVVGQIEKIQASMNEEANSLASKVHLIQGAMVVIGLALIAIVGIYIYRGVYGAIGGEPALVAGIAERIAAGDLNTSLPETKGPTVGIMAAMRQMHGNLKTRIEADQRAADEMLRIKIALDNVSTGVMIADAERTVIYANNAVLKLLQEAETDIRRDLPSFNAANVVGSSIDQFHKNPQHQAAMIAKLNSTHTASFVVGGHHMVVTASPVINTRGERLGAVAEWQDRSAEVAIENEVADIVSAATMGDLSQRLTMDDKSGFFASLSEGLNQLLDNTQRALTATSEVLGKVAQGDLTQTIDADFGGIFRQLKDDTNATIERLREVVGQIKASAEAINTASKEIAAGNSDLSSRTEQQASSIEETSSSMEELNGAIKQNTESAEHASSLAKRSSEIGARGGEAVQKVVSSMELIQTSSKKISDIISVIDSIAFQTNILALNAAVEAARAGEQGRGFAVVATEVRNLAQRSADAAKEIKGLITTSNARIDEGVVQAGEAGETIEEVVTTFELVSGLVEEIMDAGREQSSGVDQVTQAIGQMDEVTQQNAALVEEAAAAAESLEEQARALVQSVSMFKLSVENGRPTGSMLPGRPLRDATARRLSAQAKPAVHKVPRKLPPTHLADEDERWAEF